MEDIIAILIETENQINADITGFINTNDNEYMDTAFTLLLDFMIICRRNKSEPRIRQIGFNFQATIDRFQNTHLFFCL